jgi:hypothetical protein
MGWDGPDFVDWMVHFRVISFFVCIVGFEEWDEICLGENI